VYDKGKQGEPIKGSRKKIRQQPEGGIEGLPEAEEDTAADSRSTKTKKQKQKQAHTLLWGTSTSFSLRRGRKYSKKFEKEGEGKLFYPPNQPPPQEEREGNREGSEQLRRKGLREKREKI